MKNITFTKKQFDELFYNDDVCLHKIFEMRYKETSTCPKCGRPFKYHKLKNLKLYSCQFCGNNIAPTADTIFHKSSTSLKNWFYAIYLFSVSKNGVSGKEIERHLGVTYKTAWRIANRVRSLFKDDSINPLENIVEVDETYFGGKEANKHKNKKTPNTQGRSTKTKTPIIGAVQRQGSVKAEVVTDTKISTVQYFLKNNIKPNTIINTDEYNSYKKHS